MQLDIRPGRVIFPNTAGTTAIPAASTITLCPIDIPIPIHTDRLIVALATVAVGTTPGPVELGLYLAGPRGAIGRSIARAPIASSSFLATLGNKFVDLDRAIAVPAGRIWCAFYNPGFATTQPTLRAAATTGLSGNPVDSLADSTNLLNQNRVIRVESVTTGLPETLENAVLTFVDNLAPPFIGLRVAAAHIPPRVVPDGERTGASVNSVGTPGAISLPSGAPDGKVIGLNVLPTNLPGTPGAIIT